MKEFLSKLVDFDTILYDVHNEMYDPLKHITDFWNKYDIKTCHDYFVELFIVYRGNPLDKILLFDADQMHEFMVALLRMHVAYYMAHCKNIDLEKIAISNLETSKITLEELKVGEKIYQVFHRVSQENP